MRAQSTIQLLIIISFLIAFFVLLFEGINTDMRRVTASSERVNCLTYSYEKDYFAGGVGKPLAQPKRTWELSETTCRPPCVYTKGVGCVYG